MSSSNELTVILDDQGVDKSSAKLLLDAFGAPFEEAGQILKEYQTIVVTDETDKATMLQAREKRLALKKVRTTVENKRKALKEDIVKQGRAIDSVARFVKEVITPAEDYLQLQEDFAKIKEQERLAARKAERIERLTKFTRPDLYSLDEMSDPDFEALIADLQKQAEEAAAAAKRAEEERLAAEEAERQRQAEIARENDRLKKEAAVKEAQLQKEREAAEKQRAKERAEYEAKLAAEQAANETRLAEERKAAEAERLKREELERAERERREKEERERLAAEEAERTALLAPDKEKLHAFAHALAMIRTQKLPAVKTKAAQDVVNEIESALEKLEQGIITKADKL